MIFFCSFAILIVFSGGVTGDIYPKTIPFVQPVEASSNSSVNSPANPPTDQPASPPTSPLSNPSNNQPSGPPVNPPLDPPVQNPDSAQNDPSSYPNKQPVDNASPSDSNDSNNQNDKPDHGRDDISTQDDSLIIDETRSIGQLIVDYGYHFNKHYVTTSDGYILSIYRINNPCIKSTGPLSPVILAHSITQDSSIFIDGSPNHNPIDCSTGLADGPLNSNLGFLLADLGYDVFLPNFRGFRNSRNHSTFDPAVDMEYWDFSFDEMGKYDAPMIIDLALNLSTYSEVIWIGHGVGTAIPLILFSDQPFYESKIKHVIGLAPAVFLTHTLRPATRYLADSGLVEEKKTEIGPKQEMSKEKRETLINERSLDETIKRLSRSFFSDYGYDPDQTNVTRLPVFYSQKTLTSSSTYTHLAQLASSPYFKSFDGGEERNMAKYGQAKPPLYKITQIRNVNFTFYASPNDKVAVIRDIRKLVRLLKVPVDLNIVKYNKLNHFGFLWALNRDKIINDEVVEVLKEISSKESQTITSSNE